MTKVVHPKDANTKISLSHPSLRSTTSGGSSNSHSGNVCSLAQHAVRSAIAPSKESKLYQSIDEAVADIRSGSVILSSGFGLCGTAETIIAALVRKGPEQLNSLTVVSNNIGTGTGGGLSPLVAGGQIKRAICSYLGGNDNLEKKYFAGDIAIELVPQGTLAERIRAGGAGIPAFYTPTGVATLVESGGVPVRYREGQVVEYSCPRETRVFDGRKHLLESAIVGDVAILRAWKVDLQGNCRLRYTTKAFSTLVAKAAKVTIVEAENLVPLGELSPDEIDIPGVYIDRITLASESRSIDEAQYKRQCAAATSDPHLDRRIRIARRAASELMPGSYVNLGIGIPTLAVEYLQDAADVWIQSENGIMGMGPFPTDLELDQDVVNAGKQPVTLVRGASTFDSAESFGMIRGGHLDIAMLGALQVSAGGDLANYSVPGRSFKGMGGAMDLVSNPAKTKIIVLTHHVDSAGKPKVVSECSLPLTGAKVVSTIITDLCVFQVDRDRARLTLTELAPDATVEEVRGKTGAPFDLAPHIVCME